MLRFPDHDRFQRQSLPERRDFIAVFFYVRYAVSYRDLEEIMAEQDWCRDQISTFCVYAAGIENSWHWCTDR
jgi:hypothetical protein